MRHHRSWSRPFRGITRLLIATQIAAALPVVATGAPAQRPAAKPAGEAKKPAAPTPAVAPAPPVRVNRTVPKVSPPPLLPQFSATPTDEELFRARVFQEPLVAMGSTTPGENQALAAALTAYLKASHPEETAGLEQFLSQHPDSAWNAGLLTNLGVVYRRTGFFTKAYAAWEKAWALSSGATEARPRAIADKALAELAELSARLGRMDAVEKLLAEAKERPLRGSATEKITGAQEGLWLMQHKPEEAFKCGPMALDRILEATRRGYSRDARLVAFPSTTRGTSMAQMQALAGQVGLSMQMAFRTPGAKVLVPAMVHWKAGHFAALVKEEAGRYLMQDPTFGDEMWVTLAALDEEASGFFLVPKGDLPAGWKAVGKSEGEAVWGKGAAAGVAPNVTGATPGQRMGGSAGSSSGSSQCPGMAGYTFNTLAAGLHLVDTPVGYTPALGPSASFTVRYTQRDINQPQVFSYSNLGPKWTFEWLSYLEDDPSNPSAPTNLYLRGAGVETNSGFNTTTSSYARSYYAEGIVVRTSAAPIRYERRLSDGSVEVFAQPDGAASFPRRVFMTESIDPQGNRLQFTYDSSLRLVAVADALGQVSTLSYDLPADPLKITRVTDPFGRFATMEYDEIGRLVKITDAIGMASEFTYAGSGDFISALTTPYGTTQFSTGQNGYSRWIEATDTVGGRERLEYRNSSTDLIPAIPASAYPPGYWPFDVSDTVSVYWSKLAMATAYGDFNAAHIIHWMRNTNFSQATGTRSHEKRPLEGRAWYSYPGQSNSGGHRFVGSLNQPTEVARLLDDGQVQSYRYEYNARGMKTREIDPVGRETVYVYGTNNVPDPDPATGTGIDLLQVKVKNAASTGGWDVSSNTTYDQQHRSLTTTDGAGQSTTYTYTADGRLKTVTTPPRAGITEERTTTYTYDTVTGSVLSTTGPGGVTSGSTYDGYGRLRTSTDNDGYTLTYDYDLLDRPTRIAYPDGTYEETQYDGLDPVGRRDRLGRWSHTFHDSLRRVVATTDAAGRTVRQEWCTCGSLERTFDPNGNPTTWEYDAAGRVTREIRANNSFKTTVYEATTSRVKKKIDAKLQETQYAYARDGKLLSVTYVNAEHPTPNVSYNYTDPATGAPDAHGRLRQLVDGTGMTTYVYHAYGQLGAGHLASVDGPSANDTINYTYDELDGVLTRTLHGLTTTWTYDALGRLVTMTDPIGDFLWSYVGTSDRVDTVTYPNGQSTHYSYYPVAQESRLQEIHHRRPGGATLNRFTYSYDPQGNILTWGQQADDNPVQTYTFEYNRADQLTAATLAATNQQRYRYSYDAAGNRAAEQINDSVTSSTYDNMNRLVAQAPGGALAFGGVLSESARITVNGTPASVSAEAFSASTSVPPGTSHVVIAALDSSSNLRTNTYRVTQAGSSHSFAYDANGNLIDDGTRTYEWDAENRLLALKQDNNVLASFGYDASGRRVTKSAAGITTRYLYDGHQFLEESRSNDPTTIRHVYGSDVDHPLAQSAGEASYLALDHVGSVFRVTDAAGNPTITREYDPWGTLVQGAATKGYSYAGREWDPETGLYYYRARYYASSRASFISEDPLLWSEDGSPYAYAGSNPIRYRDPSGLYREADGSYMTPPALFKKILATPPKFWGVSQQCVSLVRAATEAPATYLWWQGKPASSLDFEDAGRAIATFNAQHRYPRGKRPKNSALFLSPANDGIWVVDQFPTPVHPAEPRKIYNRPDFGISNDASAYSVILCKE